VANWNGNTVSKFVPGSTTPTATGVTSLPAAFSVKLGKLSELSYTKNGLCVMLG
jgi:hypothetical protein